MLTGMLSSGSTDKSVNSQKVEYMAHMKISPWAKLTISIRPKMSDSPAAITA